MSERESRGDKVGESRKSVYMGSCRTLDFTLVRQETGRFQAFQCTLSAWFLRPFIMACPLPISPA